MQNFTSVTFYFSDFKCGNEHFYDTIEFLVSKVKKKINSNIIPIKIDKTPSFIDDYYIEEIQLSNSKAINKSGIFYYPVYINKKNNIYTQVDTKGEYCFEILYYNSNSSNLPKFFNFIDSDNNIKKLDKFDYFGIPNVLRFSFLNVNKNQINAKETNIHLAKTRNSGSYTISNFNIDNFHEIRIHRRRREKYTFMDEYSLNINEYFDCCNDAYNFINENYSNFNDEKQDEVSQKLKFNYDSFTEKILNIRLYSKYIHEGKRLTEKDFKCCVIYGFVQIIKDEFKINVATDFYKMSLKIMNYTNLSYEKKINLLFGYYRMCNEKNIYINDCEIVNFHEINKNSAYYKAWDFLKKIINMISIKSKLFTFFYLCNSGSGSNRLYADTTTFKLSMISEKTIKAHIIKLLPEAVFRYYYSKGNECGVTFTEDKITFLNEGNLFRGQSKKELKKLLLEQEDKEYKYSMPLLMALLHEIYGHAKNAYHYKSVYSPNRVLSNDNFIFGEDLNVSTGITNLKKYFLCFEGESGRALEFFISSQKEIIYALKFSFFPMKDLFNIDLWVDSNFDKLNKIVNDKIVSNNLITISDEEMTKLLPGFPEENKYVETIVQVNQTIEYVSDNDYDNDDFKYDKINEIKINKRILRDWKI